MGTTTDRLVLRQLQPSDADWITQAIAKPQVHKWLTAPPKPYRRTDAEWFIETFAAAPYVRVICEGETPCGVVSLIAEKNRLPNLGYWLCEDAWGRGLMTEAVRALLNDYFDTHDTDVMSGWMPGNIASANVLTKLGFLPDGVIHERSHFYAADVPVEKVRMTQARWHALSAGR